MAGLLTLDSRGILLAFVIGILLLLLGGSYSILFLVDIILFLVISAAITGLGKQKKVGLGIYEESRGWKNVLSNGIVPLAMVFIFSASGALGISQVIVAEMYMASIAAVTADKFASEIGVLNGEPTMLLTFRKVKKGVSGAVTALGTGASLFGALIIGISSLLVSSSLWFVVAVTISGFLGCLVDSILGYYEEKGIGNKYTTNFLCSVAGSVICAILILAI